MDPFASVTLEDYEAHLHAKYALNIGERMDNPLWVAAFKTRESAYQIAARFDNNEDLGQAPRFCFSRVGASFTVLEGLREPPRFLWIGGEHEDSYDPDFFIYNDVAVMSMDGSVEIFGFPRDHFPPTDFHTATNTEHGLYIIGGLRYKDERNLGTTPIYVFDLDEISYKEISVRGPEPGWIYRHSALYLSNLPGIMIYGGSLIDLDGETYANDETWVLDLNTHTWSKIVSLDVSLLQSPRFGL